MFSTKKNTTITTDKGQQIAIDYILWQHQKERIDQQIGMASKEQNWIYNRKVPPLHSIDQHEKKTFIQHTQTDPSQNSESIHLIFNRQMNNGNIW